MPVRFTVRIVNENDRVVFDHTSALGPGSFGGFRSAGYRFELSLSHLEPGPYLLTVEAVTDSQRVKRDVRLRIK